MFGGLLGDNFRSSHLAYNMDSCSCLQYRGGITIPGHVTTVSGLAVAERNWQVHCRGDTTDAKNPAYIYLPYNLGL